MNDLLWLSFLLQSLAYATPLLFAALGELFSERVGIINIGLEGLLLIGALAAVLVSALTGAPLLGVLAAIVAGTVGGALFGLYGVYLRRDQVIVGTTLNFLALGLTGMLYRAWTEGGTSAVTAPTLPPLFGEGSTAVSGLSLLALFLIPLSHWLLYRTRLGVTLRATGEIPEASAAAGTNVNLLRFVICLLTGALCGLGGATLSISILNTFTEGMTAGRGFIALAIVVFGRWTPTGVLLAALLFAAADVGQSRLQAANLVPLGADGRPLISYPVFLAVPYVLTLLALAIRGAKVRAPAALGQPFDQG
ncbi:MAG: ABC transporter permease [Armatimonadaceae bacterium]